MTTGKGFHRSIGTVSALTLLSRALGLLRDVLSARAFGLGTAWDVFSVAWTVPNLFRRLFGEGALGIAFIPVFTDYLANLSRREALHLWGVVTALTAVVLGALVLLGEGVILGLRAFGAWSPRGMLLLTLTAMMLPYAFFICLTALKGAALQGLRHFTAPALAPVVLNVCWAAAVWLWVPRVDAAQRVFAVAAAVLVGGFLQLALQLAAIRRMGVRLRPVWDLHHEGLRRIARLMAPMLLGLAVFQLNVLLDKAIALGLSSRPGEPGMLFIFGQAVPFPMREGAAAALYWADRLYALPVGVFGIAVATVIYPALATHAARGATEAMLADLRKGMRLVLFVGLPAGAGLMLLGRPIVSLFYGHGEFLARGGPENVLRVARILAVYAAAVWAYCANQVMVRGYYALGDTATPIRVGAAMVGVNLALNLTFIWFLAEAGLALATAIAAVARLAVLALILKRRLGNLGGKEVAASAAKSGTATLVMSAAVAALVTLVARPDPAAALGAKVIAVALPTAVGVVTYLAAAVLLRAREVRELLGR